MDRDEILKKAQAGKIGMDEREQQVLGLSFGIGGILTVLLAVLRHRRHPDGAAVRRPHCRAADQRAGCL